MDSTTLLLVIVPLLLGIIGGAVKFMRIVGFVAGGGKRPARRSRGHDDQMSFDERLAERLRELERQQR
jgi:F0F1-type ATP synthase assembly protein I